MCIYFSCRCVMDSQCFAHQYKEDNETLNCVMIKRNSATAQTLGPNADGIYLKGEYIFERRFLIICFFLLLFSFCLFFCCFCCCFFVFVLGFLGFFYTLTLRQIVMKPGPQLTHGPEEIHHPSIGASIV